jgi:plastocyanin
MKKLLVVLSILFIGILLAGCTTQPTPIATPTPTPEPTAVPTTVVTTVPTEIPTTVVEVTTATPNSTPTPTPTPQPSVTITFNNDGTIKPGANVVVPVGGKVIWLNNDAYKPHGVVAINVGSGKYFGGMNSVNIPYGKTFEATFDTVGSYDYKTVFQPSVEGKITVTK